MLRTKTKLRIARVLNGFVVGYRNLFGLSPVVEANRRGINWRLDLNEGIDLALYLGLYQKIQQRVTQASLLRGSLVIDIGANIGAHALPLAQFVENGGRVVAVEPTHFAYKKLLENIERNPQLAARLVPVHAALTDGSALNAGSDAFYSRWPLREAKDHHPEHLGIAEATRGARYLTLDSLLDELRASSGLKSPVAFIKLDVDGNELQVMKGARRTLNDERPVMLIEIAPHVQDEVPQRFESMLELLKALGYRLEDASTGEPLPESCAALRKLIKFGASIDAIARPVSGSSQVVRQIAS